MKLKPQDFFIGVIDFFSVILPGALVTYFLKGLLYADVFGIERVFPSPETKTQQWIVFLLATYIIGNIIFLIASLLLDRLVYDKYLRDRFFKKNFDLSYHTATAIREQYIPSESWINHLINTKKLKEIEKLFRKEKREIINTYKWAQNYLAVKFPETLADIRKLEADSKFFRSLVVAFIIIALVLLGKAEWIGAVCFFVLSLLCLYRYGDLRYKSTERAYELIITVNHLEKQAITEPGVQFRDNRARFLPSIDVVAQYQNRITTLTKGLRGATKVLAIPENETWEVSKSASFERLYCLNGKSTAKMKTDNDEEIKIIMTPNAIIPLPAKSSFEISNEQQEPLMLLILR